MKITKTLLTFASLFLITSVMTAQVNDRIASIEDLHVATGVVLLNETGSELVIASDDYLIAAKVPERVARLIRDVRLENTGLAQQSVKKGTTIIEAVKEDIAEVEEENNTVSLQHVQPGAGI